MSLPLVHSAIGAIRKVFPTEIALIRTNTRVEYQVCLQGFSTLESSSANITFELFVIRVDQLVHVEGATCVELHTANIALIVIFRMRVRVYLKVDFISRVSQRNERLLTFSLAMFLKRRGQTGHS